MTYLAELLANVNPEHLWLLDETTNSYVDSGTTGGLTLAQRNLEVPFRLPGLARDGVFNNGFWTASDESSESLERTTGIPRAGWNTGGFGALFAHFDDGANNIGTEMVLWTQSYASQDAEQIRLNVTQLGAMRFVIGQAPNFIEVDAPNGTYTLNEPHSVVVIQRGDGAGPRIILDGVDVNAVITLNGTATNDGWADSLIPASAVQNLTLQANGPGGRDGRSAMCLPFFMINNAPPTTTFAALHAEANLRGAPQDYYEYHLENFGYNGTNGWLWSPGWVVSPGSGNRVMTTQRAAENASDPIIASWPTTSSLNEDDATIPSRFAKYQARPAGSGNANSRFITSTRPVLPTTGNTVGTISICATVNSFATNQSLFELGLIFGGTNEAIRLRLVPGLVGIRLGFLLATGAGAANEILWTDAPQNEILTPTFFMLTAVQDGTSLKIYVNGERSTFDPIVGANLNGMEWIQTILDLGQPRTFSWGNDNSSLTTKLDGIMHDLVVTGEALTAEQVAARWDAVNGRFAIPGVFGTNTWDATLGAINPTHWWKLDEATSQTRRDTGVGTQQDLVDTGAARHIPAAQPGLVRGTPRVYSNYTMQLSNNFLSRVAPSDLTPVNPAGFNTCCMGGVVRILNLDSLANYICSITYANSITTAVWLRVNADGSVEFTADFTGTGGVPLVRRQTAPGTVVEGGTYFICGVQRADGMGPRVYIDGVDAGGTLTTAGTATADSWAGSMNTGQVATDLNVGAINGTSQTTFQFSSPFLFVNDTPTDQEIQDLQVARNVGQGPSDYADTVWDLAGGESLQLRMWHPGWFDEGNLRTRAQAAGPGARVGEYRFATGFSSLNPRASDVVSAFNYYKYIADNSGTVITNAATSLYSAADLTGSVNFLLTVTSAPVGTSKAIWELADNVTGQDRFTVQINGSSLGFTFFVYIGDSISDGSGNRVTFATLGDFQFPTVFNMLTLTQDGTGMRAYLNGSPITLTVQTAGTGFDATSWIGTAIANFANPVSDTIMSNLTSLKDWTPNELQDFFYTSKVLSDLEVSQLWDAVNGIFPDPIPPPPSGGFADTLGGTGNGGAGPDWWWRGNRVGGIFDVGSAQDRPGPTPPPINADSIATGGDPTFEVAGPLPDDPSNAAFYLDGVGDYFEVGVNGAKGQLLNPSTGTVGFYVSRNAQVADNIVFSIGNAAYDNFWQIGFNGRRIELIVQRSPGNRVTLTSSMEFGAEFVYVTLTADGANFVLYVDGAADTLASVVELGTGQEGDWFDQVTGAQTAVGARGDTSFTTQTTGRISELFLYDGEVLSADQIAALQLAAIQDGVTGTGSVAGVVIFEGVTFKDGALADVRAEDASGNFQQMVKINRSRFIGGNQGSASYRPQSVLLRGAAQAEIRACEFDLNDTPTFGRGGVVGSQINTAALPAAYGSILVADCSFNRMGYLNGADFLAAVMAEAGFGLTAEWSRFTNGLGVGVGWRADAQNVAVVNNVFDTLTSALGAVHSAAGLNAQLGSTWLIRGNRMVDVTGTAMINLEGVTSAGGNNYARNVAIVDNELDNNLSGQLIRATQLADVLIDGNQGDRCTEGIRLGIIESSCVVRSNAIRNNSATGIILAEATLVLVNLAIERNRIDGPGNGITISQVRDAAIKDNVLQNLSIGIQIGTIASGCVIGGNQVIGVGTPFALLGSTTQTGLVLGTNHIRGTLGAETVRTVTTNAITAIAPYHAITANPATDLNTVNFGKDIEGFVLVLRRAPFSQNINVRDGVGNLQLNGDFAMNTDNSQLTLVRRGSDWYEVSRFTAI